MDTNSKDGRAFKIPCAPPIKRTKKTKQRILPEEQYIAILENIIQRDFFPDLEDLKARNQYLDKVQRNNSEKDGLYTLGQSISSLDRTAASAKSPMTFETPVRRVNNTPGTNRINSSIPTSQEENEKSSVISKKYSLDAFLGRHTSEDNESFQSIINNDMKIKEAKLQRSSSGGNQLTYSAREQIEGPEDNTATCSALTTSQDGVLIEKAKTIDAACRKLEIDHASTRFIQKPFDESLKALKDAASKSTVPGNATQKQAERTSFLATPSPVPGGACTPLMTWGEIEDTPYRLEGNDTPLIAKSSFRIHQASRRETIALELAEKAGERMRGRQRKATDTIRKNTISPYIRLPTDRLAALSPAAKRLAADKLGLRTTLVSPATKRNSVTPIVSQLNRDKSERAITPRLVEKNDQPNLTDNLLDIPGNGFARLSKAYNSPGKRLKAHDFFKK